MAARPDISGPLADFGERVLSAAWPPESPRRHIGASALGGPCRRRVWLEWRWAGDDAPSARMRRLWHRGHREEEVVLRELRAAGVEVIETQRRGTWAKGHCRGSCDGVIRHPDGREELLEIKTSSYRRFLELSKAGSYQEWSEQYFAQIQIYMALFDMPSALVIVVCKDDDRTWWERVERDEEVGAKYMERGLEMVGYADQSPPPVSDARGWYQCRMCPVAEVCFGERDPVVSCRTCRDAYPVEDGRWACRRHGHAIIPIEFESQGCGDWAMLPEIRRMR